jgi:hypothetical protein
MKIQWFKRPGWFHLPASSPGTVITPAMLAYCAQVFPWFDWVDGFHRAPGDSNPSIQGDA